MIQSVERAFLLLYTIGSHHGHINISQLARDVGLPRTTVVRLLETLQAVGAVKYDLEADEYQLGDQLLALLNHTPWQDQLIALAQPCLQKLATETGETVYLCLPDGDRTLFATQINSRHTIQMVDWTGTRSPMHVTAAGKLFLAHRAKESGALSLSKGQARYFEHPLQQYTEFSLTSPEVLSQQFEQIQRTGISWTREEFEIGLVGMAAAIINGDGEVIGAAALEVPKFRLQGKEEMIAQLVRETANQISQRLQH